MNAQHPLVSLCITCYNQAKYIREALQSAFDQTYSPLEIVICDDCSTDGTFEIVNQMTLDYHARGGKHALIVKRNERNLNVLKNYEQCFRLGHGEILVTGSGDDVQLPDRVDRIVEAWLSSNRRAACIYHGWICLDENGHDHGEDGPWPLKTALGAATAYVRGVVDEFPLIVGADCAYEDHIFTARSAMLGDAVRIDAPLIKYRMGCGLSTMRNFRKRRARISRHAIQSYQVSMHDLEVLRPKLDSKTLAHVNSLLEWRFGRFESEYDLCWGKGFFVRWKGYKRMRPEFGWNFVLTERLFYRLPCLLPFGFGDFITTFYVFFKSFVLNILYRGSLSRKHVGQEVV